MRKVYVGIDVGSKVCAAATIDSGGQLVDSWKFATSEKNLIHFATRQNGRVSVLIEESEMAGWAYRTLTPYVQSVEVCDPKVNAWISKSSVKNDKVDALRLAELLRLGSYSPVYHPEEEDMAAFKSAVKQYEEMTRRAVTLMVKIKAHLRQNGVVTTGKRVFGASGREEALFMVSHPAAREIIMQDFRLLDQVQKERATSRALVVTMSRKYPVIESFEEIPGVGPMLAARFVAYVQTPYRFSNKRKFWRYCRLGVVDRSSNDKPIGRKHLDRTGNGSLKDLSRKAFEGAMRSSNDNQFKRFYRRSLARTGDHDHARLNTQRKILAVMLAMWRDGTEYYDDLVKGA